MDLGIAVEAIPNRVASDLADFAANCVLQVVLQLCVLTIIRI